MAQPPTEDRNPYAESGNRPSQPESIHTPTANKPEPLAPPEKRDNHPGNEYWWSKWTNDPAMVLVTFAAFLVLCVYASDTHQLVVDGRNTAERQLRAYVFVNTVTLSYQPNQAPRAKITIKNSGQTPAYKVTHWSAMNVAEFPLKKPPPPPSTKATIDNLPPGGGSDNVIVMMRPINIDDVTAFGLHTAALYVVGHIDYTDAFNIRRCTGYRQYVGGDVGFNGQQMAIAAEGNDADKNCE